MSDFELFTLPHPVDQTQFGSVGNCVQASIATLLGYSLEEVPSFPMDSAVDFWEAIDDYLDSQKLTRIIVPDQRRPDMFYLASGPTERFTSHMVVMYGDQLIHDPHPSRKGLLKIDYVQIVVPTVLLNLKNCGKNHGKN